MWRSPVYHISTTEAILDIKYLKGNNLNVMCWHPEYLVLTEAATLDFLYPHWSSPWYLTSVCVRVLYVLCPLNLNGTRSWMVCAHNRQQSCLSCTACEEVLDIKDLHGYESCISYILKRKRLGCHAPALGAVGYHVTSGEAILGIMNQHGKQPWRSLPAWEAVLDMK